MQQCWLLFVGTATPGGDLSNGKIAGIVVSVVVWLYYLVLGVAFMVAGPTIWSASANAPVFGSGLLGVDSSCARRASFRNIDYFRVRMVIKTRQRIRWK